MEHFALYHLSKLDIFLVHVKCSSYVFFQKQNRIFRRKYYDLNIFCHFHIHFITLQYILFFISLYIILYFLLSISVYIILYILLFISVHIIL